MLGIKRQTDERAVKRILHRVADIPGGVSIDVDKAGGSAILEGTPLAIGEDGLFEVVKYGVVDGDVSNDTTIEIQEGAHFQEDDVIFCPEKDVSIEITGIDGNELTVDTAVTLSEGDTLILGEKKVGTPETHEGELAEAVLEANKATQLYLKVAKGHNFRVGDFVATKASNDMTGKEIWQIQPDTTFDFLYLVTAPGVAIANEAELIAVKAVNGDGSVEANQKEFPVYTYGGFQDAVAIAGSNYDIEPGENLLVDAWVKAVVRDDGFVPKSIQAQIQGVNFVPEQWDGN